ncbi:MAG TPA: N-acetylneuraminate synthase family protein [Kofleriaceae bacterium]|nr:N-acetylneuraminate synthase family protein [Kofleriaceae bacterium]
MVEIRIGERAIGPAHPPLLVAEVGANHDGSEAKAEAMLRRLVAAGAEAVKFQYYTADALVSDPDRVIAWGPPGRERREAIGPMFDRLSLPRDALARLFALGRSLGVIVFATPFDEQGADQLAELGAPCFKLAASDVNHLPLLRHVARLGRPIILSFGKCTMAEADEAARTLRESGARELCFLHCVAQYPAPMEQMNLRTIPVLAQLFPDAVIGLSDHSIGSAAPIAAVALGASLVEKHVTCSRDDDGPDHWFSFEIDAVGELAAQLRGAHSALGGARRGVIECEEEERRTSTRSLVTRRPVRAGQPLRRDDIKIVRPGTGLAPRHLEAVVGMRLTRDLPANTPLRWEWFR